MQPILNVAADEIFSYETLNMTSAEERVCLGCGETDDLSRLERCPVCTKYFCPDCAHRAQGRRFCCKGCSQAYFYDGDSDDNQNDDGE